MAEPALDRPGVVPLVREGIAASVPQHMRVFLDLQTAGGRGALEHPAEPGLVNGEPRSLTKTKGDDGAFPLTPSQCSQPIALDRMRARRAVLDPADAEHRAVEVDLVPTQVAGSRRRAGHAG